MENNFGPHVWRKNNIFTLKSGLDIWRCKYCGEEDWTSVNLEHDKTSGECPKHILKGKNENIQDKK